MTQLQRSAGRHLWRHFAAPGLESELSIFVRGEGCYVWDERGRRHLDALSSLFCVNIGHGRDELGQAAAAQARELGYATTWDTAHPRAIELAERVADLAPGELNRVFFLRWLRSGRVRTEADARIPSRARRAGPGQGDRARAGLPWNDVWSAERDRVAVGSRSVRAPDAGRLPRPSH